MISRILLVIASLVLTHVYASDGVMMVRSSQKFPEAMLTLQTSIAEHGYMVSHVQRIDIGLTGMGYKTDKYRVVFFVKPDEINHLTSRYPDLASYLPPKIAIFAEGENTILVTIDPVIFDEMVDDPQDRKIFKHWENDILSIFADVKAAE